MKFTFSLIIFFLVLNSCFAQELNCKVTLNTANVASTGTLVDKQIFSDIERTISTFMNTQKWTTDNFAENEKIKCNLNINITKAPNQTTFLATAQFQVIRPVFNTNYETVLLQVIDNSFDFTFTPEDRQMIFNELSFTTNLSSLMAYYSLMALAVDYDSFSDYGGTQYLDRAANVARLANNSVGGSWGMGSDTRTRFALNDNLRNQVFMDFRDGFYNYHRLALDDFAANSEKARKIALDFLQVIKRTANIKPNAWIINALFDAKYQEFINIFSEGSKSDRQTAYSILSALDGDKIDKYRTLLK